MSRALLARARASLPPTARPIEVFNALSKLTDAQWVADGRPSAWQQATEAWERRLAELDQQDEGA